MLQSCQETLERPISSLKICQINTKSGIHYANSEGLQVLQVGWKDNAFVTFMSTIHNLYGTIERNRRQPSKTSRASGSTGRVFGDFVTLNLPIPSFVDDYNHCMDTLMSPIDTVHSMEIWDA